MSEEKDTKSSEWTFDEKQEFTDHQIDTSLNPTNNPLYLDGWEGGLVGWTRDKDGYIHAVYSEEKCIKWWAKEHPDEDMEDVESLFESNVLRSLPYIEEHNVPYIIHTFELKEND